MEGEAAASATVYMEYIDSPTTVERLTTPAPEGLVRESNVVHNTRASPNGQLPASELATPIPRDDSSTQLVCTELSLKSKLRSTVQLVRGNWRTGLEFSILTGIIIIVWGLFSVPTILYALPPIIREVS